MVTSLSARLSDIHVRRLSAEVAAPPNGRELGFDVRSPEGKCDWAEGNLFSQLDYTVVIHTTEGVALAELRVGLVLVYAVAVPIDESLYPRFLQEVAQWQAWAFLRAELHALSCRVGFPALTLPPIYARGGPRVNKAVDTTVPRGSRAGGSRKSPKKPKKTG